MNINEFLERVRFRLEGKKDSHVLLFFDKLFRNQFLEELNEIDILPSGWAENATGEHNWKIAYALAAVLLEETILVEPENFENVSNNANYISEAFFQELKESVGISPEVVITKFICNDNDLRELEESGSFGERNLLTTDELLNTDAESLEVLMKGPPRKTRTIH